MNGSLAVARVVLPEKGVFLVALPEGYDSPAGTKCLVRLDYGEDVAEVKTAETYDSARHGERPPGFELIRPLRTEDAVRLAANAELAEAMGVTFSKLLAAQGVQVQLNHVRLSFGRERFFVRIVAGEAHVDAAHACAEMHRLFNVTVNFRQLGPRDQVAFTGALGPCGRPCCCTLWPVRYAAAVGARARAAAGSAGFLNGICGRYKCCLAFDETPGECPCAEKGTDRA